MSLLTWTLGGLGLALSTAGTFAIDGSDLVPSMGLAVVGVVALHGVRRIRQSAGQPHSDRLTVDALYLDLEETK